MSLLGAFAVLMLLVLIVCGVASVWSWLYDDYEQDDYSPDETWVQPELRFSSQGRVLRIERYDEEESL